LNAIRVPSEFPSPNDVRGKRIVVTGASRGLGLLIATGFSRNGAIIGLVGRDPVALERVALSLPGETLVHSADVRGEEGNESVADAMVERFGGLDGWIANAGGSPIVKRAVDTSADEWRDILDLNLSGVFFGARAAARVMTANGAIVVTGSIIGERPRRGLSAYAAAKGGVISLVKALAVELGPSGITVNVVSPGWFESPLAVGFMANPSKEAEILGHTALRRWGQSEDLVGAYLYLCSPAARFVTGTVIGVDGGYLCV
jgi:3-oxoacyl-[acyl-carrier protein] reductase